MSKGISNKTSDQQFNVLLNLTEHAAAIRSMVKHVVLIKHLLFIRSGMDVGREVNPTWKKIQKTNCLKKDMPTFYITVINIF